MVKPMKHLILWVGLWLFGTAGVAQAEIPAWVGSGERLEYALSFGPIGLGTAVLDYRPRPTFAVSGSASVLGGYAITATASAKIPFLSLQEDLSSRGAHVAGFAFRPSIYTTRQRENSYRSDKVLTFDWSTRKAAYKNFLDTADVAKPIALVPQARDMLSALYALRMKGREVLNGPVNVPMVGLKRTYRLKATKGPIEKLKMADGKKMWAYRIPLVMEEIVDGKPVPGSVKDAWTIWASDTAAFVPVKIEAKLKFGTFSGVLKHVP